MVVKSQLDAVAVAARPYSVYTALLSQTGTSAPVAISVLENTLGGGITWRRNAAGLYVGTFTGIFIDTKTWASISLGDYLGGGSNSVSLKRSGNNTMFLFTNRGTAGADNILNNASVEIRIYN